MYKFVRTLKSKFVLQQKIINLKCEKDKKKSIMQLEVYFKSIRGRCRILIKE
jgi:hypothetical protein